MIYNYLFLILALRILTQFSKLDTYCQIYKLDNYILNFHC